VKGLHFIVKNSSVSIGLAPMAGVTDWSFRELTRKTTGESVDFFYTEMVSAKGLIHKNKVSFKALPAETEEVVVQLFGSDPEDILQAAGRVLERCPFIVGIDINAACPVKKVVKNGAGAALLKNTGRLREILEKIEPLVHSSGKRLSIKIRKGWDSDTNYADVIEIARHAGADYIAIHGRTVEQGYSGKADVLVLEQIPGDLRDIIWSGDVVDSVSLEMVIRYPVCGILIGRASIGNPWVFKELKAQTTGGIYVPPTIEERIEAVDTHIRLMSEMIRYEKLCGTFKKFVVGYTRGRYLAKSLRNQLLMSTDIDQLRDGLVRFLKESESIPDLR
jgi:nifR3 family TIM-barrel protein